jgi:hypothetical protein
LHERNLNTLTRVLGMEDATRLGELLGRLIEGLAAHSEPMPLPTAKPTNSARTKR